MIARGKTKLQALVAVMRKLLHAIYGMFKHCQPYNGAKVFPLAEPTAAWLANISTVEVGCSQEKGKGSTTAKGKNLETQERIYKQIATGS